MVKFTQFYSSSVGFLFQGLPRVYLWDLFGFCVQGLDLQEFLIQRFIKHGISGEVKDDGSHGKES